MRSAATDLLTRQTVALAEVLINNAEPLKARMLLERCAPVQAEHTPEVRALLAQITAATAHADDELLYAQRYGVDFKDLYELGTEPKPFADQGVLALDRATRTYTIVQELYGAGPDGEPFKVLSVGAGDCTLEKKLLESFPSLQMTICEKNETASEATLALQALFPDRVTASEIVPDTFDLVMCLEVIEHVQDEAAFAAALASALKEGGTLLLSTPNGPDWYEPIHMARLQSRKDYWFQHLRAFSARTLGRVMVATGLLGHIMVTPQKTLFYRGARPTGPLVPAEVPAFPIRVSLPVAKDPQELSEFLASVPAGGEVLLPGPVQLANDGATLVMYQNVLMTCD